MCIVANSVKSYRITYAYLNVVERKYYDESPFMPDVNAFIDNNRISLITTGVLLFFIVVILFVIVCISKKYTDEKKKRYLTKYPTSQMNAILEKTLNSMKNVRLRK